MKLQESSQDGAFTTQKPYLAKIIAVISFPNPEIGSYNFR
jgi:hypothetical protein